MTDIVEKKKFLLLYNVNGLPDIKAQKHVDDIVEKFGKFLGDNTSLYVLGVRDQKTELLQLN